MTRPMLLGMVVIGALFGAGGMLLAERVAPGDLSGADRTRVERVVRETILANPDLIPAAMQKLQDRDTARAIGGSRSAVETPYAGAVAGNRQGDVTVVQFYDYNCGYCRASLPVIDRLIAADPKVRVVFREFPILAETSRAAARASLAAAAQGRFDRFHRALYAGGRVSDATIAAAARTAGVDLRRPAPDADAEIDRNLTLGARLGINGTPAWVIGDRVLSGAVPLDHLAQAVAAARAR